MPEPAAPALPHTPVSDPPFTPGRRVPTCAELFLGFGKIAVCGFGGVLAWSRRVIVQERGWMSPEEFNEQLALCQVLPGPNIVNFSVMFGSRAAGVLGSLAALFGLLGPPVIFMILAGILYRRYGELPELRGVLAGLAAAAAGLLIATSLQMIRTMVKSRLTAGHIVAAVTFIAAGVLRVPLLWVMAVVIPISIAFAWWERR
ncbi:MAG TPA: chromate transporter [Xanthobacteraceae bacterium]|jgi:chromate transporter|nr:chromate transporter [Xanthobacteraceae bacterium]